MDTVGIPNNLRLEYAPNVNHPTGTRREEVRGLSDVRMTGMAGEHRIISELLLRGHNPAVAIVDYGIDIILENGKTIQAKATSQMGYKSRENSVSIDISSTAYTRSRSIDKDKVLDLRADFFIVWIIPIDAFYIIPRGAIANQGISTCLSITHTSNQGFAIYRDRWDLLEEEK